MDHNTFDTKRPPYEKVKTKSVFFQSKQAKNTALSPKFRKNNNDDVGRFIIKKKAGVNARKKSVT